MKILKLICCLAAAAMLILCFSHVKIYADDDLSALAEESGINDTADHLSSDARQFLEENGISPDDPHAVENLTPDVVIDYMWDKLKNYSSAPLRLLGMIISVIVISAAWGSAADAVNKGSEKIYSMVTVFAAVTITIPYLEKCMDDALDMLVSGSEFMLCYVPVFSGIAAAAGNVTSAASYNIIVLFIAQAASKTASDILMPVISVCMAMNITESVNSGFTLSAVNSFLKKWITLITGFIMTIFTGLLSIQSIVGVSADTIGVKAAKFVVSNFVPVVGGAVADAYTTMRSGLGMLRGAAGAFGTAAVVLTLLPPLLEAGWFYFVLTIGEAVSGMFGVKSLENFFRGCSSLISLIIAILSCFTVMFVISTIILMAAGLNASSV